MKVLVALFACIVAVTAFDCYGRNNTCTDSHTKCDTGYVPFCEHFPGPHAGFIGICTCDKECSAASDCSNLEADGCPPHAHAICDQRDKVCHCGPPHHVFEGPDNDTA